MPIFIVGEKILNKKLECIISPVRPDDLYYYQGIQGKIAEKAGKMEMDKLFRKANPFCVITPFHTDGLNAANTIIHLITLEMSTVKDFKDKLFLTYDRLIRYAISLNVKTLVFPPIPYSYKRKGAMNSYKTASILIKHFYNLYNPDFTIFILENNQGFKDHKNNYHFNYISTSYPLSKRHKPLDYPFVDDNYLNDYLNAKELFKSNNNENRNYNLEKINDKYSRIYYLIKQKYKDDASFCMAANITKTCYINFLTKDYKLSKQEVISICFALHFSLQETIDFLSKFNYLLDLEEEFDIQIKKFIENNEYDVFSINETLYLMNLPQIGSICSPAINTHKDKMILI